MLHLLMATEGVHLMNCRMLNIIALIILKSYNLNYKLNPFCLDKTQTNNNNLYRKEDQMCVEIIS